jgi:DNA polymerase-3 subunit epsilon
MEKVMANARLPQDKKPIGNRDLCFIDIETTGLMFGFHEIIDIGAVRTSPDVSEVKGVWKARIRPRHPDRISGPAQATNGYSPSAWENERPPSEGLWREFVSFASGCVPVAHNPSFDRGHIALAAADVGIHNLELEYHWIGTESLAWPMVQVGQVTSLSLESLCELLSIPREPQPHTGIDGAMACMRVYQALLKKLRPIQVADSVHDQQR